MAKKNNNVVTRRAWNILRMALLWARKGGVFNLRVVSKFMKSLVNNATPRNKINYYFERELSFDKTPIASSMRFHIPCFNSQVDFDENDDYDLYNNNDINEVTLRKSFLKGRDHDEEEEEHCEICEEKSIDDKAEEFIAKFKLQRQISYLKYN